MIRLSYRIIESWNAVIRAMLNVMNWSYTWHKHSFFIVLHMNDGLIPIIIFWGQPFIAKHRRTPFLWNLHSCFIDCPDNLSSSAFRSSLEALTDCPLPLDLRHYPIKVTCALLPYLRVSNFGINKIHLFSSRIDWLFRQPTTATMLCWFEREKHQLRVPIRYINSCQIHILDMVIGSMYSRAS